MNMDTISESEIHSTLKKHFGFSSFREGQLAAIETLFADRHLLCILPTGHGKSLLYQLPAVMLDGITIVISPLLALMRDQLQHLNNEYHIPAASINSDQSYEENAAARTSALNGKIKVLFVAPEQLDDIDRFNFLLNLPVSLIVIDEAHCISTWGHDFRPSYRQIIQLVHALEAKYQDVRVLGLTATASQQTENDIKQQLAANNQTVVVHRASMDRPNIHLSNIVTNSIQEKLDLLLQLLPQLEGCGLIYCATRENVVLVSDYLKTFQINAEAYHAGFESNIKRVRQQAFIRGKYKVIVATNALGMGIDKSDLRFIIHFDVPGSITAYYQEVGRCGRDGMTAYGILLFNISDKRVQEHFIRSAQPTKTDFQLILDTIRMMSEPATLMNIKRLTGLHPTRVQVVVAELLEQEYLKKEKVYGKQVYRLTNKQALPNLERYQNQHRVKMRELAAMLRYGELESVCLMAALRKILGDDQTTNCSHCSNCSQPHYKINQNGEKALSAEQWLSSRVVIIPSMRIAKVDEGVALIDGVLKSQMFIDFMRNRQNADVSDCGLSAQLIALMYAQLQKLHRLHNFTAIISVPSKTWAAKDHLLSLIADELKIKLIPNFLNWRQEPEVRQGELSNNDQRKHNVSKKMSAGNSNLLPRGNILLVDDYIGSGATTQEAARALRKEAGVTDNIVPFMIAKIKWRLGSRGMV